MTPQLCDIATVNNEGVRLIKNRQYDEASGCFRQLLDLLNQKMLRKMVQHTPNHPVPTLHNRFPAEATSMESSRINTMSFARLANEGLIVQDVQVLPVPANDEDCRLATSGTNIFLFQNPISLQEIQQNLPNIDGSLLIIALNNLALSYYLAALEARCQRRLEYAIFYYELSYQLLLQDQEVLLFQVMVVLNNLGHAHKLVGNSEVSKNCFQFLLAAIVSVQHAGQSNRIRYWDSFVSNIMDVLVISAQGTTISHCMITAAGAA